MEHKTWTTMDKESWGPGPWADEIDKEQFSDEATGLPCLIKRNQLGALCGYVGVPEGHPWHGAGYGKLDVEVHGGLTFADSGQEGPEAETICHVPGPGEPDQVYWLGFDCNHGLDVAPGMTALGLGMQDWPGASYKTVAYVKAECAALARQAADAAVAAGVRAGGG